MTILAVGCSFLCYRSEIRPQCVVMAEKMKVELDNRSIPGNGNVHIVYNTMNALLENPNKYSLVLIGWSNPGRWDFVTAPHKWFSIKIGSILATATKKKINVDLTLFRHWAPQVVLLASWLRSIKVPFIMWNSLKCWHEDESIWHKHILDMPEFYQPRICHIQDVEDNHQWVSPEDHHPSQISHNLWAEKLLAFYQQGNHLGHNLN